MEEQMAKIKQNLKAAQDKKKSYADKNIILGILKWANMYF